MGVVGDTRSGEERWMMRMIWLWREMGEAEGRKEGRNTQLSSSASQFEYDQGPPPLRSKLDILDLNSMLRCQLMIDHAQHEDPRESPLSLRIPPPLKLSSSPSLDMILQCVVQSSEASMDLAQHPLCRQLAVTRTDVRH